MSPIGSIHSFDAGAAVAALLLESAHDGREIARAQREAAVKAEANAQERVLEHMQDAASAKFCAGLTDASGSVVAGGLSMASALPHCDKTSRAVNAAGETGKGITKGGATLFERSAADADMERTRAETAVAHAKHAVDDADANVKAAKDLSARAIASYGQYVNEENETRKALLFRV